MYLYVHDAYIASPFRLGGLDNMRSDRTETFETILKSGGQDTAIQDKGESKSFSPQAWVGRLTNIH